MVIIVTGKSVSNMTATMEIAEDVQLGDCLWQIFDFCFTEVNQMTDT